MEPTNGKKIELGLKLTGIVISKSKYISGKGEEKYQLNIACPGNKENIQIAVPASDFNSHTEMDKFERRISVSSYNGRVSFNLLEA